MTIAATYPAAVIGMAVLRLMKGSILEENIARTVGSIGESVAAGAIFTIPAFVISGAWPVFDFEHAYWKSSILMLLGGVLGILFVTLLRRVMVEDPELPFPESVAASQIHIAGQQGSRAAKILFGNMGFGGTGLPSGSVQPVQCQPRLHRQRWKHRAPASCAWDAARRHPSCRPVPSLRSRRPPSALRTWASATSSGRVWLR